MNSSSSFNTIFSKIILLNPLNIAAIIGLVCVLAFAVVLIQPENLAKSQNDIVDEVLEIETHQKMDHDGMMEKHHSMIKSLMNDKSEHTISVTGIAQTNVKPDLLVIEFGVETNGDSAKSALDSNSNLLSNAISELTSMGFSEDDLSTSRFSITPLYDYYQDKETGRHTSELIGYQVTNILQVETKKLDSAAIILDSVVSSGVNKVNSVYFTISPESHLAIKDGLIESAIENAKSKAQNALLSLDQKIVGVKSITLDDFISPMQTPMFKSNFAEASMFNDTPIFSSESIISTSVNIIFLIDDNS